MSNLIKSKQIDINTIEDSLKSKGTFATVDYVDEQIEGILGTGELDAALDTIKELQDAVSENKDILDVIRDVRPQVLVEQRCL